MSSLEIPEKKKAVAGEQNGDLNGDLNGAQNRSADRHDISAAAVYQDSSPGLLRDVWNHMRDNAGDVLNGRATGVFFRFYEARELDSFACILFGVEVLPNQHKKLRRLLIRFLCLEKCAWFVIQAHRLIDPGAIAAVAERVTVTTPIGKVIQEVSCQRRFTHRYGKHNDGKNQQACFYFGWH
jgi:hypothetical protein